MSGTDLFSQTSSVSSSPGRLSATSRTVASEVSQAFDPFAVGLNQQQQQQQQVQSSPSSNLMRPPSQPTSAVMSGSSLDFGFLNGGGINNSGSVNINSHNSGSFNSLLNYDPFDPLAPSNVTSTTSRVSTSSYRTSNTHASYASDFLALDSASPPTKLLSRSATGLEEFSPLTSVAGAEAAAAVPLPASRQNSTQSSPAATMTGLGRTSPFYTPQMQQNQLQLNQYSSFTQIQLPAAAMPPPKPPRSNQNSFG